MTRVFPVIHHRDIDTTFENVDVAVGAGVTGVFLINHARRGDPVEAVAKAVRERTPSLWIGINCLYHSAAMAIAMPA